jgi:hypothetical protein
VRRFGLDLAVFLHPGRWVADCITAATEPSSRVSAHYLLEALVAC